MKTKRLISYTLGFFFLFASLGYACPDLKRVAILQEESAVDEMAAELHPCQDPDHDANPLCQYILHDRISYPSAVFSLAKVAPRGVFYLTESRNDFAATAVFRTPSAPKFHSKLPLTFLYHVLRV